MRYSLLGEQQKMEDITMDFKQQVQEQKDIENRVKDWIQEYGDNIDKYRYESQRWDEKLKGRIRDFHYKYYNDNDKNQKLSVRYYLERDRKVPVKQIVDS